MIRFDPTFQVCVLQREVWLAIHHASVWAALGDLEVVVIRARRPLASEQAEHGRDLEVDLAIASPTTLPPTELCDYLSHILPPAFIVSLEKWHVHVEWAPRGLPPA